MNRVIDLRTGKETRPVVFYAEEKDSQGRIIRKVRRDISAPVIEDLTGEAISILCLILIASISLVVFAVM